MKAIRVRQTGKPDVMTIEEVADPAAGPGQVVVDVKAVGVNPVEVYIRAGTYPSKAPLPYTPGADAAGVVKSVGAGVNGVKAGDRVYTAGTISGAYAEQALCEAAQVHPLPERVSFAQGAGVNVPYATAWRAMFVRGHAWPGHTVLIHGASGGVGIAAVQIGKSAGIRVIGTAGTEKGMKLVREQGADFVVNHTEADYLKKITDFTGGRGPEVILEVLANVNLNKDLGIVAKGGCVVVIGSRGAVEIDPRLTMGKDVDIRGMSLMNADAAGLVVIHAALEAGLANGSLRPIINCELPLAQAAKAHEKVMESGAHGKIVMIP